MDEKLLETIEYLMPFLNEMGEERLAEYCKCYLLMKFPKANFYFVFKEYVEHRDKISINSFREFLKSKVDKQYKEDLIDIISNIEKYNIEYEYSHEDY